MTPILEGMLRAQRRRKLRQSFHLILFFTVLFVAAVAVDWAMESVLYLIIAALP